VLPSEFGAERATGYGSRVSSRQPRRYADLSKPRTSWDLRVELPEGGMRLDRFLAKRVDWKSRNELQTLIDEGRITVNGTVRKASTKLAVKDNVVVALNPGEAPDYAAVPVDVLHEDEALLCVNKRPGIVVHPVGRHQMTNLLSALHARYRNHEDPGKDRVPHVCHRIDKDTSGCFLVAFSQKWKADVSAQFESREVEKQYLALVHGIPREDEGVIDAAIRTVEDPWPVHSVDPRGAHARTRWKVEERFASRDAALVRFFPETGRTHQIRVHSAHLGHPLLCDTRYGGRGPHFAKDGDAVPVLARCALHAARLEIRHPQTQRPIVFEAPLAPDMAAAVDAFRRG
jgi:23S rRNA pseudouridine1911/1915/1917 synthase